MEEGGVKNFMGCCEEEKIPVCEKERMEKGKGWEAGFTFFGEEAGNGISGAIKDCPLAGFHAAKSP